MIRIDLAFFYRLGQAFQRLKELKLPLSDLEVWVPSIEAENILSNLFHNESVLTPAMRSSIPSANALRRHLGTLMNKDLGEEVTASEIQMLNGLIAQFEPVLTGELSVADAYYVEEKPPYSTVRLMTEGECLFPPDLADKVPEAVADMKEAGKCLAFELATACGFHTMRAMECVLRRYWSTVTKNKPHPRQRNLGVYLNKLEEGGHGPPKVIAALRQIKDLHRNELNHPGDALELEEAIALLGLARSAVTAMLSAIAPAPLMLTPPDADPAAG